MFTPPIFCILFYGGGCLKAFVLAFFGLFGKNFKYRHPFIIGLKMKRKALVWIAFFTIISLSTVALVGSLESTVLNEEHVIQKMEEQGFYGKLMGSIQGPSDNNALSAKGFMEAVGYGEQTTELVVNGLVESILVYLKNPGIHTIEFGLPKELFSEGTVSVEELLPTQTLGLLEQGKGLVLLLLLFKNIALVACVGFIVLLLVLPQKPKSKMRWFSGPVLLSGLIVLVSSLLLQSLVSNALSVQGTDLSGAVVPIVSFLKVLFGDFYSVAFLFGLILFSLGSVVLISSFFSISTLKNLKNKKRTKEKV